MYSLFRCFVIRSLIALLLLTFSNTAVFAEIKGSVSSYIWSNDGEFILEGRHPTIGNSWYFNHPTDSMMIGANTYFFEMRYNEIVSADLTFNSGFIRDEKETYIGRNSQGYVRDLSYASAEGRTNLGSVGLFYRLMGKNSISISRFDIGVGYISYKSSVTYKDASVIIDWDNPSNNNKTFTEDWEKYDIYYRGIDLRIKEEAYLTQNTSVSVVIGYAPHITAKYTSVKYPERPVAQQQKHIILADGDGIHYEVRLNYYYTPNFSISGGYKYLLLKAQGDNNTNVYPMWNGSEQQLRNAMGGFILGVAYHF